MQNHYKKKLNQMNNHYHNQIDELNKRFDELNKRFDEANNHYRNQIDELNKKHEAFVSSTSWKITKPLRVFMRLLKNDPHTKAAIKNLFRRSAHNAEAAPITVIEPATQILAAAPVVPAVEPCLRLTVVYLAEGPSSNVGYDYRCKYYAQAMAALGADVCILSPVDVPQRIADIKRADILIVWRATFCEMIQAAIAAARTNKAVIIFDIDDLIFEPKIAKASIIDGMRFHKLDAAFFTNVMNTALASDMYTATTNTLSMYLRRMGKPTFKLVNGYSDDDFLTARRAVRKRRAESQDGLIRIGYAGGTKTHQKDFSIVVTSVVRILKEYPQVRLVLFKLGEEVLLELSEFPELENMKSQIEWRNFVPHCQLPEELARFDISLAPLEVGNPFCEAKSELKFFESALANVCVIASPTEPYINAIEQGVTGFLANNDEDWYHYIKLLIDDGDLRKTLSANAFRSVLWPFGYQRRVIVLAAMLNQIFDTQQSMALMFAYEASKQKKIRVSTPSLAAHDIVYCHDLLGLAYVTVVIPLYNYENYLIEALESVKKQSLNNIDIVIVDDKSTDNSLDVAVRWAQNNAHAFNRIVVASNHKNSKLDITRNTAIELAETPYVFPLDPDNRLLPNCLAICLNAITKNGASFAYAPIRHFGDSTEIFGELVYHPTLLAGNNFLDAMAMIAKCAWAEANGYKNFSVSGWEDYSLWCTFAEMGMTGVRASETPMAEYRVHSQSMLRTITNIQEKKKMICNEAENRHPWLTLIDKIEDIQ